MTEARLTSERLLAAEEEMTAIQSELESMARLIYLMREGEALHPDYEFVRYDREIYKSPNYNTPAAPGWEVGTPLLSLTFRRRPLPAKAIMFITFPLAYLGRDWWKDEQALLDEAANTSEAKRKRQEREAIRAATDLATEQLRKKLERKGW